MVMNLMLRHHRGAADGRWAVEVKAKDTSKGDTHIW